MLVLVDWGDEGSDEATWHIMLPAITIAVLDGQTEQNSSVRRQLRLPTANPSAVHHRLESREGTTKYFLCFLVEIRLN